MKGYKNQIRNHKFLKWLLLFSNWLFQGIINLDKTEKIYKILFTGLLSIPLFYIVYNITNVTLISIFSAFFIAHTLNWIINGNLAAVFIHRLYKGKIEKKKAFVYLEELEQRLNNEKSIKFCGVFGSIARGEMKDTSDIDIAFVRERGFLNAVRSIYFLTKEKNISLWKWIPIECYIADNEIAMLNRFKDEKVPVVLKNSPIGVNSISIPGIILAKAKENNKI